MADAPLASAWEQAVRSLHGDPAMASLVRDAYYDEPLLTAAERYWRSEEWADVRARLGSHRGRALDVGAGRGIASYALAKEGFKEVVALEPDGSALVGAAAIRELASGTALPICVVQDYAERLPLDTTSFDVVFARAALHHTGDLDAACREFYRVLRRGGRILAVREHVISRPRDLPAFLQSHPLHRLYGGENAFPLKRYVGALRQAGFEVREVLAPFDSPINYAPRSLQGLTDALADRVGGKVPTLRAAACQLIPALWRGLRPLLNATDRRPGRLYSFIAVKA